MKKRGLCFLFCIFVILLVSCKNKSEEQEVNVRFEIDDNIQIDLEHYHPNWVFGDQVKVYCNEVPVLRTEFTISKADSSEIKLGDCDFIVSYVHEGKEYKETFTVHFIDAYSTITIHMLDSEERHEVENGSSLETVLSGLSVKEGFTIAGYYLDEAYEQPYDVSSLVNSDLEIYAKHIYEIDYEKKPVSAEQIAANLDVYIQHLIDNTPSYRPYWNNEGFKGRWNYIDGVFLNSIINLYYETNKADYKNFFINYINYYIDEEGNFIHPETKEPTGYRSGELDSVCESRVLFDAYDITKDERYLKAIHKTYEELMKMSVAKGSENFSHKESYLNQIWLDGMYMYVPFLARYAVLTGQSETFGLIKRQYEYIRNHMFDETKKLYYHGHDTTKSIFWADKTTGNSKNFWLRSNGWLMVSLVDVLEYFPEGEDKEYLKDLLNEALEGILKYKDEKTNLFYQLIDKGPTAYLVRQEYLNAMKNYIYGNGDAAIKNYLETSGSSMVAYTALKASRMGYVSKDYEQIGVDIFEGIYGYSYKEYEYGGDLKNICITGGLGPETNLYRDGSVSYYLAEPVGSNDAKGVGPFLMAYLEYAAIKEQIKRYNTITQVFPDGNREISFLGKLDSLPYYYIEGYIFEGFYYDEEFTYKITNPENLTDGITIYCKYVKEAEFYETLKKSEHILLEDDFDSYHEADTLPEFTTWGTKGIYYYINDKEDPGTNLELNHIQLGNGDAYLYDNSEYDGTQLIIDSGNIRKGIVKGYLEVSLENAGNSWTFFQIYGERSDKTYGEIFGARFDEGFLKYRVNGGEVNYPSQPYIFPNEESFKIEYIYDLDAKQLTVRINRKVLVSELDMSSAESFGGIKIVSSDKMAYFLDEYNEKHYVHRRARVDNVIIVVEEKAE